MKELERLTRIARKSASRYGAQAASYASGNSFDILTERHDGIHWVKSKTRDAFIAPRQVALIIRRSIKKAWTT